MPEVAPVGRSVVKVRATDQDTGTNAKITYKITSGDDQGKILSLKKKNLFGVFKVLSLKSILYPIIR